MSAITATQGVTVAYRPRDGRLATAHVQATQRYVLHPYDQMACGEAPDREEV